MKIIPVLPVGSQKFDVVVNQQSCSIAIYQREGKVYFDLYLAGVPICLGILCTNRNRIVRYPYLKFIGDFCFVDTQGSDDPVYSGLGGRFLLVYLEPGE